jgi:excinuclease ABC subunit B
MVIDESHVTVSQVRPCTVAIEAERRTWWNTVSGCPARWTIVRSNSRSSKGLMGQTLFVSATPADYELQRSEGVMVEQVVRPTGLLDPPIHVRPSKDQIDDLLYEIRERAAKEERVLVTTLTKRMAEELNEFLGRNGVRCKYIHSDVETWNGSRSCANCDWACSMCWWV